MFGTLSTFKLVATRSRLALFEDMSWRFTWRMRQAIFSAVEKTAEKRHPVPKIQSSLIRSRTRPSSVFAQDRAYLSSRSPWSAPTTRRKPESFVVSRDGYTRFGNKPGGSNSSRTSLYIVGISGIGAAVYIYYNIDKAPFTGRTRILGASRKQELALGAAAYQDILDSLQGRLLPLRHPESQRVRRVVAKIAGIVRKIDPSLSEGFQWQVVVAAEDEPNAFCVPGGRILITTGLLRILPTDDDLAIVLGHEIAHALNRHGAESMHLQRMLMPILFLLNQLFDLRWTPTVLITLLLSLPYSRKLEYEADEVGLRLCVEACYDPRAAPDVFRRLAQLQNERSGTWMANVVAPFLSTHPQSRERAARLRNTLPDKMERYNRRCTMASVFPSPIRDFPNF